jgi:hypothetical protein
MKKKSIAATRSRLKMFRESIRNFRRDYEAMLFKRHYSVSKPDAAHWVGYAQTFCKKEISDRATTAHSNRRRVADSDKQGKKRVGAALMEQFIVLVAAGSKCRNHLFLV